jgi:S1-C subfamily serine protease
MNLNDLFTAANPSIVGFISRLDSGPLGSPTPHFPAILGTGFFVDTQGMVATNRHVIEAFSSVPAHPTTRQSSLAAVGFFPGPDHNSWQMLVFDVLEWFGITSFSSTAEWYGEDIPDIGFVQLEVKDIPALPLASSDFYLKIGMSVATIGYPMGRLPLAALGKLHQASPFIRHGIVSSVFPFPTARPHGFTIDIMQQGGSSGSPIFSAADGKVVGMMKSSIQDWASVIDVQSGKAVQTSLIHKQNTNISFAEPAHIIAESFAFFSKQPRQIPPLKSLTQLIEENPDTDNKMPAWDVFIQAKPKSQS